MIWKIRDFQSWTKYRWYTSLSVLARKIALKYHSEGQITFSFSAYWAQTSVECLKQVLDRLCRSKIDWDTVIFRHRVFGRRKLENFSDDIVVAVESKILVIPVLSGFALMIHVADVPNRSLISDESVKNRKFLVPRRFATTKSQILIVRYPSNDPPLWRPGTS